MVVQQLEAVEVAEREAERAPVADRPRDLASSRRRRPAGEQAGQRIVIGEEAHLAPVRGETIAAAAWFATSRAPGASRRRQRRSSGSSARRGRSRARAGVQPHEQPVAVPRAAGRDLAVRDVRHAVVREPRVVPVVRQQEAARHLDRGGEQRLDVAEASSGSARRRRDPSRRLLGLKAPLPGGSAGREVLEASASRSAADVSQDLVGTGSAVSREETPSSCSSARLWRATSAASCAACTASAACSATDDEHVELLVASRAPARRLAAARIAGRCTSVPHSAVQRASSGCRVVPARRSRGQDRSDADLLHGRSIPAGVDAGLPLTVTMASTA